MHTREAMESAEDLVLETSCQSGSVESSDTDSDDPALAGSSVVPSVEKKGERFTAQKQAILNSMYNNGMRGVGVRYSVFIDRACQDTGLTTVQVQRWIKKKRYRQKHARDEEEGHMELPVRKKVKLSSWQCFFKDFGQSKDGKESMRLGIGEFNKAAKDTYNSLSASDREALKERGSETSASQMTKGEIRKRGAKIFLKIQKLMEELEALGYAAFGIGYFEEDVQFTSTKTAKSCSKSEIIEYLHALIIAGNPPSIEELVSEEQPSSHIASSMQPASKPPVLKTPSKPPALKTTSKPPVLKTPSKPPVLKTPSKPPALKTTSKSPVLKTPSKPPALKTPSKPPALKTTSKPPVLKTTSKPPVLKTTSKPPVLKTPSMPPASMSTSKPSTPKTTSSKTASKITSSKQQTMSKRPLSKGTFSQTPSESTKSIPESSMAQPSSLLAHLLHPICEDNTSIKEEEKDSPESVPYSSKSEESHHTMTVSDSPIKDDQNEWLKLPKMTLYKRDRSILESAVEWLNSNIIHAAHVLLKRQFPRIFGLMVPQLADRKQMFNPVPPFMPFIQILNINRSHWIAVSNIDIGNRSNYSDAVSIYDSGSPAQITRKIRQAICSLMKPAASDLHFDLVNIMLQPNGSDCGVFAIACATELAHGFDPAYCYWDCGGMRSHLHHCLETGTLSRFPCTKKRRLPLGGRVKKSTVDKIYCTCRSINDSSRPMIWCDMCRKCFHMDCEGLDPANESAYLNKKWICSLCTEDSPESISK